MTEIEDFAVIFLDGVGGGEASCAFSLGTSSTGASFSSCTPFSPTSPLSPFSAGFSSATLSAGSGSEGASTTSVASCSPSVSGCASTGPDPSDRISSSCGGGEEMAGSTSAIRVKPVSVKKDCARCTERVGSPQVGVCDRTGGDKGTIARALSRRVALACSLRGFPTPSYVYLSPTYSDITLHTQNSHRNCDLQTIHDIYTLMLSGLSAALDGFGVEIQPVQRRLCQIVVIITKDRDLEHHR